MDTSDELLKEIREFRDRRDIMASILRYCRGVDRRDAALAKSAYHADAKDDHGHFIGPAHDFIDWLIQSHDHTGWSALQHHVTNHTVEILGDTAHGETYYIFVGRQGDNQIQVHGGRYVDRFERRDGLWAIADRVCVYEWGLTPEMAAWGLANQILGRREAHDISNLRPLVVTRAHRKP